MAITYVKSLGTTQSRLDAASFSIATAAGGAAVDDLVIASVTFFGLTGAVTVADNSTQAGTANTWLQVISQGINGSTTNRTMLFASKLTRALLAADSITFTHATALGFDNYTAGADQLTGASSATADRSIGAGGSSTAPDTGLAAAVTAANELLFASCGQVTVGTFTAGTDGQGGSLAAVSRAINVTGTNSVQNNPEYRIGSVNGTQYKATGTFGTTGAWAAVLATFQETAAVLVPLVSVPIHRRAST
jgi:hypothetical protein